MTSPVELSSCILTGSPMFDRIELQTSSGILNMGAVINSEPNIYVSRAWLNDKPLDRVWLILTEFQIA